MNLSLASRLEESAPVAAGVGLGLVDRDVLVHHDLLVLVDRHVLAAEARRSAAAAVRAPLCPFRQGGVRDDTASPGPRTYGETLDALNALGLLEARSRVRTARARCSTRKARGTPTSAIPTLRRSLESRQHESVHRFTPQERVIESQGTTPIRGTRPKGGKALRKRWLFPSERIQHEGIPGNRDSSEQLTKGA